MTQVYFKGQGASVLVTDVLEAAPVSSLRAFAVVEILSSPSPPFFSFLSPGVPDDSRALLKSNAVPGVFGVFVDEPNDANAPEPRPKADEPVEFGDWIPEVLRGAMALKGLFRLPWEEESPPKRLELEKVRDECEVSPLPCSRSDMERDSLPLLDQM